MEIHTVLIDSRERRWFGKVAKAAEGAVNDLLKPIGGETRIEIHAHFDAAEGTRVQVVDCKEDRIRYTQVVYAAKDWQTVADSIADGTAQLASAALVLVTPTLRPELASLLSERYRLKPIHRSSREIAGDGLTDFYLYVEQVVPAEAFFALIEKIDSSLSREGAGQVSGNAYSLHAGCSCIDLVSADRKKTQAIAEVQLATSGIDRYRFEP